MEKIGIVTIVYNGVKVLPEFFDSLKFQKYQDFVLYVVDNNSSDGSVAECERLSRDVPFEVKIFAEKENWGVAKGNNIGIIAALNDRCDYILLANNDTEFAPNTILNLLEGLKKEGADMAVPKAYYFDDKNKIWCAGGGFRAWRGVAYHIGWNKEDNGEYEENAVITYSPTCFMLIKSEVFYTVGLMDEKYFVYYDDTDFVWRAVKVHHKKLVYISNSVLYHKVSSSTGGEESDFSLRYMHRNNKYFLRKHIHGLTGLSARLCRILSLAVKWKGWSAHQREIILKARAEANKM